MMLVAAANHRCSEGVSVEILVFLVRVSGSQTGLLAAAAAGQEDPRH